MKVGADGKASVNAKDSEGNSSKVESDNKGNTSVSGAEVSEDSSWTVQDGHHQHPDRCAG